METLGDQYFKVICQVAKPGENIYHNYQDQDLKDQLKKVCDQINDHKKMIKRGNTLRSDLFLELRSRGYSYKEIGEIVGCSHSLVFKEVLKWERYLKYMRKDQPGVLDRSSLY